MFACFSSFVSRPTFKFHSFLFIVVDLPLPHHSRRLQLRRDRLSEELDQLDSLSSFDQTLPLQRSRGDTSLPFTDIDLERPFVHR